jgi:hypothetical protein
MGKINNLTRGGIYSALSVIILYISSIAPTSKLSLLTIASAIIPFSLLTTNVKTSILVYIATSILSAMLGLRSMAIAYALFFGLYSIVKYYIEKIRKAYLEIILKLTFFNISFLIIYYFGKLILSDVISINLPLYYLIPILEISFIIYDYVLTNIISYINRRFVKQF